MTMEHWEKPAYKNWGAKRGALMGRALNLQHFRENLKLVPGGETGPVNDTARESAGSRDIRIAGGAAVSH